MLYHINVEPFCNCINLWGQKHISLQTKWEISLIFKALKISNINIKFLLFFENIDLITAIFT